jgi:hypothetical protein
MNSADAEKVQQLIERSPKILIENVVAAASNNGDYMVLVNLSGEQAHVLTYTPEHMKRLQQYLAVQVEEYEKQYGTIQAEWVPGVKSPIQITE